MDLSGVSGGDHGDSKAFVTPLIATVDCFTTFTWYHSWGQILLVEDWRFYELPVNVFFPQFVNVISAVFF